MQLAGIPNLWPGTKGMQVLGGVARTDKTQRLVLTYPRRCQHPVHVQVKAIENSLYRTAQPWEAGQESLTSLDSISVRETATPKQTKTDRQVVSPLIQHPVYDYRVGDAVPTTPSFLLGWKELGQFRR